LIDTVAGRWPLRRSCAPMRMATTHWIRIGVGGLFVCAFAYVLWLSNTANRDTVQALRATSTKILDGQNKQQLLLHRVESRLAQTSAKYLEMERAFGDKFTESLGGGIGGGGGGFIAARSAQSPGDESTLRKETEAAMESDTKTALEMLTETYHKLLDQLKLAEERHAGNSTADRALRAALMSEVCYLNTNFARPLLRRPVRVRCAYVLVTGRVCPPRVRLNNTSHGNRTARTAHRSVRRQ
jgi:hypothetical protein